MKNFGKFLMMGAVALSLCACDDKSNEEEKDGGISIELNKETIANWTTYAEQVAKLLEKDASDLLNAWEKSYEGNQAFATTFKEHTSPYSSALSCIEEIIDGCADIANEVGEAKIGDPYNLYLDGQTEEALYAVESWYSWHSREDYANNILSIRNSYFGSRDNSTAEHSMSALVKNLNPQLDTELRAAIATAQTDIMDIPAPFRNNINCGEVVTAMESCAALEQLLSQTLKGFFLGLGDEYDAELDAIVDNYVEVVILPTYRDLAAKTKDLATAVKALNANPTDETFAAAAQAWFNARTPWEQSEAFLFGPVDELGLDPNMDSWPLDQTAISNHIGNADFSDLETTDEDGLVTEASQSIRGFHTLEFLIFDSGYPRKVSNF
ncbi:MAG: peptidase M75 [Bacteroides sp.]|nr:peptidase M75 [Bacteroides sp.]MCM1378579.1 peptidase M75 [Bacteroides sp.]MCM1444880.1 peptidase M75 [Prevotella sp.]